MAEGFWDPVYYNHNKEPPKMPSSRRGTFSPVEGVASGPKVCEWNALKIRREGFLGCYTWSWKLDFFCEDFTKLAC